MAIDGGMLHLIKKELDEKIVGGRVEKIMQPGNDTVYIMFRTMSGSVRLAMSANPSDARIHLTSEIPENPKSPPMMCMLFRKILGSCRLVSIEQPGLERALILHFEGYNEIGDPVTPSIAMEVMGRYSNLILIDSQGNVVDAVRRVDSTLSGKRIVLPGVKYELPPPQEKMNIICESTDDIARKISEGTSALSKEILRVMQGVCPVVSREISCDVCQGDTSASDMTADEKNRLRDTLESIKNILLSGAHKYYMVSDTEGKPIDFSYMRIEQYGSQGVLREFDSSSELLDTFFSKRDSVQRIKNKSGETYKLLQTTIARVKRKILAQQEDLISTQDRDKLREIGDILSANLNGFCKGDEEIELEDFYNGGMIKISLDPSISSIQNAQRYYSEYKKMCGAKEHLSRLIDENTQEIQYLESVFEFLQHADTEEAILELRDELRETGYIRGRGKKEKKPKKAKPYEYMSGDGNRILVGRNNRQNEELTLHMARGRDMWFHAKNVPGSHVIAFDEGKGISDTTIEEAAMLAAYYSKAGGSNQVAVDYTLAKEIKKPQGGKPGMVIYHTNYSLYTTPDEEKIKKLKENFEKLLTSK